MAHNTSRDGVEGFRSSVSASLTLGLAPSRQMLHITKSSWWHCQADNSDIQADGLAIQQQVALAGVQPVQIALFTIEEGLERWNNQRRRAHRDQFPLSDHLFTLMTNVQATSLSSSERERLTSHLAIRAFPLRNYTFDLIRTAFLELFCAPRSSLDNPSFRRSNQQRTFFGQDYGELEGSTGY